MMLCAEKALSTSRESKQSLNLFVAISPHFKHRFHYNDKTMDALLGHTGFVGSHLRENLDPETTAYFNSKNLAEATTHSFRDVYCACVPAVKWWANKHPDEDLCQTRAILKVLVKIRFTGRFVLISTIDVHDAAVKNQTEECEHPSAEPYGSHRLQLEKELRCLLGPRLLVIRLPALFGLGLKKNMLFDLLEQHRVHELNANTTLQWYSLCWLWGDLQHIKTTRAEVQTVNLYPEPLESRELVSTFFPQQVRLVKHGQRFEYNHLSKYDTYWRSKAQVLDKMGEYITIRSFIRGENHMVVSNMAWEPTNEEHALFLMQRFGVRNVEVLPTKYASWDSFFEDPTQVTRRFQANGIRVYSLQSLLYGVQGDFLADGGVLQSHLKRALQAAKSVGCKVVVLGSPSKRVLGLTETEFALQLQTVQLSVPEVKLCLEANAAEYGCHVGTHLASVLRMTEGTDVSANMDTGNLLMTGEAMFQTLDDLDDNGKIAHVQISAPHLQPLLSTTYSQLDAMGITPHIKRLLSPGSECRVSLEVKANAKMLGEQMRLFCCYCATRLKPEI